jgi:hypothetical protein
MMLPLLLCHLIEEVEFMEEIKGRGGHGRGRNNTSRKGYLHCIYCNKNGHLKQYCLKKKVAPLKQR